MLKAIETRYKGYRFRSRLEARWAVFFDACGFAWEYEPEGFDLPQTGAYLPDFRLAGKLWVEVKPESDLRDPGGDKRRESPLVLALGKAIELADHTDTDVLLVAGDPAAYRGFWIAADDQSLRRGVALVAHCPQCRGIALLEGDGWMRMYCGCEHRERYPLLPDAGAAAKARAARFEHGETPR